MDSLFSNAKNVTVYIDDIIIASESESKHLSDIQNVLSILFKINLHITPSKCRFLQKSVRFFGYQISAERISPPTDRTSEIKNIPLPSMYFVIASQINQHGKLLSPHDTRFFPVLLSLLLISPALIQNLKLFLEMTTLLKHALANSPTLRFRSPATSYYNHVTDSSNYAAGAALYQIVDNESNSVSFFSHKYFQTQRTLSTYDRELLAAYLAVIKFKTIIDGPVNLYQCLVTPRPRN